MQSGFMESVPNEDEFDLGSRKPEVTDVLATGSFAGVSTYMGR